jgi:7 transmembrane helices usually fused to an inactive transglutaminase/Inactive transglutaminase fused to 7 transmembrane helices
MSPKGQVYLVAVIFAIIGLGLTLYKTVVLHFPLLPDAERQVWSIEAKLSFRSRGEPVTVNLALPETQQQFNILDEVFASAGYGFSVQDGEHRRAVWTRQSAEGPQTLYYKLEVTKRLDKLEAPLETSADEIYPPIFNEVEKVAANSLIESARRLSADTGSFALHLLKMMTEQPIAQDAQLLFEVNKGQSTAQLMIKVLAEAGISARMVRGIYLEDRLYNQRADELVEVFDGKEWLVFDPRTATQGVPENFYMWQRGGRSLLDIIGGYNSSVRFSVLKNDISAKAVALQEAESESTALVDFNIYSLPIDKQTIFKLLLLMPIGALVVVIFRVLIGLKTSGTFMPVLIALAFIQTKLLPGIAILLTLVAAGLWIRSYLSKLDLLMVSRLAAVVITVVLLMGGFSILSYKLGLEQVLTITFFPMIIIAWTIERMSILWEESGPKDVVVQGGGSLFVAVVAYLVMTNRFIEHLTYNFPEVLLMELGLILVLGQYTGYRLTELKRFRFLIDKP